MNKPERGGERETATCVQRNRLRCQESSAMEGGGEKRETLIKFVRVYLRAIGPCLLCTRQGAPV